MEEKTVEKLSPEEVVLMDKVKSRIALAASQHEAAQLAYSNFVLQLTIKYSLSESDIVSEDGIITRKS